MEKNTSRIEALSDGVFSVAITLLAIEIGVDIKNIEANHVLEATTNIELWRQLAALWPKYFAYFNSFASVLLMWMAHHQIFKLLRTTSNRLILANGLLLLIVALVPFPTKTVGEFINTEAKRTAIVFFTGYSVIVAASFVVFMTVAKSRKGALFLPHVSAETIVGISKGLWLGLFLNIGICFIAFFAPLVGFVLNFCMWIFWAIVSKNSK